jgi:hypothetical protein
MMRPKYHRADANAPGLGTVGPRRAAPLGDVMIAVFGQFVVEHGRIVGNGERTGGPANIIEGCFSKLAGAVLRHIRVNSKEEFRQRLMAFINEVNREPVVHIWRYKIDDAV